MTALSPRLIVFDLDGTLVDSQHSIVASMSAAFQRSGRAAPSAREVRRVVGLALEEAIACLLPDGEREAASAMADLYRDAYFELVTQPEHCDPLFPGAVQALEALSTPETCLGIATGKGRRGLRIALERHGIERHFVTLQTADDSPSKPDPGMLLRAMAEAGAGPEATLMIGDTTFDMEMAGRAGTRAIGVGWGYHEPEELAAAGAAQVIARFEELRAAVSGLLDGPG